MKLVKSLLLGSAAGLVAVAGASAADLGVKKPSAVEYVKTCPTYGAGFFVVPGTTSCLKLIGRVRADYIYNNPQTRAAQAFRWRARGYVGYDHRTATEYGLLRTYVRAFFNHDTGADSTPTLEYAFIQFGGLTVGRVTPAFEHGWLQFYGTSGQYWGGYHSDITYVNSIGYTFNFGGGWSATVALEDPMNRRSTILIGGTYGGQRLPDATFAITGNQSWGEVKLAAAVREVIGSNSTTGDSELGYAFTAGAKIFLPMLSKGSNIWASFSYGRGATSYTHALGAGTIADRTLTVADATVTAAGLKLTTSWSVAGAVQYFFTPTVSASLGGAYGRHDPFGGGNTATTYVVAGQLAWTPVAGFLIGTEVAYRHISTKGTTSIDAGPIDNQDVVGRIRFQRDF
ncbi:porin [Rhabdaerophilum calidifontis]|uniref:porin n=1 Tax=Rhabdaerophilum calidifontis TaxID=2604328 RepID=UPI001239C2DB|nr:porin [Rhabdaerophilum calidifontis]